MPPTNNDYFKLWIKDHDAFIVRFPHGNNRVTPLCVYRHTEQSYCTNTNVIALEYAGPHVNAAQMLFCVYEIVAAIRQARKNGILKIHHDRRIFHVTLALDALDDFIFF